MFCTDTKNSPNHSVGDFSDCPRITSKVLTFPRWTLRYWPSAISGRSPSAPTISLQASLNADQCQRTTDTSRPYHFDIDRKSASGIGPKKVLISSNRHPASRKTPARRLSRTIQVHVRHAPSILTRPVSRSDRLKHQHPTRSIVRPLEAPNRRIGCIPKR